MFALSPSRVSITAASSLAMRACLRALAIVTAAAAVAVPKPEPQNDQPLVLELGNNAHLVSPATVPVTDTTILDAKDARATFSVPCQGCLGGDDDESLVCPELS